MSEVTSEEIMALSEALSTIESYAPTVYIDNNEPDINAEHLNHHEQGIKRVTDALNLAIGVINSQQQAITQLNSDISVFKQIKITNTYIEITTDQWMTSGKGQKYCNSKRFSEIGVTGTVISCFIYTWASVAHLVACSAYNNEYIQFRAETATDMLVTVRIVWI